jgi:hypothetical protein
MSSRPTRRRRHKRQAIIEAMPDGERKQAARDRLVAWEVEMRRIGRQQGSAAVAAFAEPQAVRDEAAALDPTGEILCDLNRACVDAQAEASAHAEGRMRGRS